MSSILDLDEALVAVEANRTDRYRRLDELERYVETEQYQGRQDWFASGEGAAPLLERAPCIAYPIVASAIDSNSDLLLGEGRFPAFKPSPPETGNEEDEDEDEETDKEQYEALAKGINAIAKQAKLAAAAREIFRDAQGCGTAVSIYGERKGRLFIDSTKAKWCTPEFDSEGAVSRLEIRYPYLDHVRGPDGKVHAKARLYRRVIDTESDTTYLPADADKQGREPKWVADKAQTFEHGLGRCPVIWYPHMRGCAAVNEIDGKAIHRHATDEIFAHDVAISQRHRAALLAGDPQWTEIGVEQYSGPKATGRAANPDVILATAKGGAPSASNPVMGRYDMSTAAPARKKGPGEVWTYPDPNAKVQLHTLPGDALKAISDHACDLRIKIAESLSVVFTDAESVKYANAMSGKAMEALRSRQLDRVDQYREDFGSGWLVPQLQGLLEVVRVRGGDLRLRRARKTFETLEEIGGIPDVELKWGAYFKPSPEDEKAIIEVVKLARDAGFVTLELCIRKLARIFGIEDVELLIEELEEERAQKQEQDESRMLAEQKAMAQLSSALSKPTKTQTPAVARETSGGN